jgi:hypothetical protein
MLHPACRALHGDGRPSLVGSYHVATGYLWPGDVCRLIAGHMPLTMLPCRVGCISMHPDAFADYWLDE